MSYVKPGNPEGIELQAFKTVDSILKTFSDMNPSAPIGAFRLFLQVVLNEGANQKKLGAASGQADSTVSRQFGMLSAVDSRKKDGKGLGLVESRRSPDSEREKEYYLTRSDAPFDITGEAVKEALYSALRDFARAYERSSKE